MRKTFVPFCFFFFGTMMISQRTFSLRLDIAGGTTPVFLRTMNGGSTSSDLKRRTRRCRIHDFPQSYWRTHISAQSTSILAPPDLTQSRADEAEPTPMSDYSVCTTCNLTFTTFLEQRFHFKTDVHKYNAQRKVRGRPPVTLQEFEQIDDLGSIASLSGSESDSSDDNTPQPVSAQGKLTERLEFRNPADQDTYIVLYKASLPDAQSLQSLSEKGAWAVIMAGGGHFVAALWDASGVLMRHKTFHRYTTRRKQGGSQAAADEARGNASRIRSAGAILRRHGEQALQREVHDLLRAWQTYLAETQCIYVRASTREKRDLLIGWHGSPVAKAQREGRLRNIPIPTRRATLKEATRIFNELSAFTISPHSLVEETQQQKVQPSKLKQSSHERAAQPTEPKKEGKGTDHLKKRIPVHEPQAKPDTPVTEVQAEPKVDELLVSLLRMCIDGSREQLSVTFRDNRETLSAQFEKTYFPDDRRFQNVEEPIGLVGVAAICSSPELVEWLLDNGAPPTIGKSPYLLSKSKAVRTALRRYWAKHPDRYNYSAAGIPSPLSEEDALAAAEKERAKRKKEREKKKEKARERAEAAKSPEQRARELRAMAAESRILGNRCAACRKPLEGITPFARLAYKYCSTDCVANHRADLNRR